MRVNYQINATVQFQILTEDQRQEILQARLKFSHVNRFLKHVLLPSNWAILARSIARAKGAAANACLVTHRGCGSGLQTLDPRRFLLPPTQG